MIRSPRERTPRRRGGLLLEVVVTLAVLMVFLGLGAGLIRLLLRLDRSSRDGLEAATALASLARDLRLDAHRAEPGAESTPEGTSLTLRLTDRQVVVYTVRARDVLRERREGNRLLGRDLYPLAPHALARFEPPNRDDRRLLALVVRSGSSASSVKSARPRSTRIVAELGRWSSTNAGRTP